MVGRETLGRARPAYVIQTVPACPGPGIPDVSRFKGNDYYWSNQPRYQLEMRDLVTQMALCL